MSDPVAEVRDAAHQALVRLARGTDFGPNPDDSQANRSLAVQRWNAWLALQEPIIATDRPDLRGGTRTRNSQDSR